MKLEDIKKPNIEPTYSMGEVAKFMGLSHMAVYRLVKSGKIKFINASDNPNKKPRYRFKAEYIQEYYHQLQSASERIEGLN